MSSEYPFSRASDPVGIGRLTAEEIDRGFDARAFGTGAAVISACNRLRLSDGRRIHHDIAAGQSHLETGGGTSRIFLDKNNPGGVGALNHDPYGTAHSFPTLQAGFDAYVAHLVVYNDPSPTAQIIALDGRYRAVQLKGWVGIVQREDKALYEYEQRYAWSPDVEYNAASLEQRYGAKIAARANLIWRTARGDAPSMAAQIPGFIWQPADRDHYSAGRRERIRGGAQHYTAGSNSLLWLTTTSEPPVSATFLVKHDATPADRGWQLVRIEDTAWTTAFANAYTVSIEYEHRAGQAISDAAYESLALTWAEITRYVHEHNLGDLVDGVKGHKELVNNPSLVCPNGIDVSRIERRRQEILTAPSPPRPAGPLLLPGNPYGEVPIIGGFKDWCEVQGAARCSFDTTAGILSIVGYPLRAEFKTSEGSAQEFERAVLKWLRGNAVPFDVVLALRSEGVPEPATP